ncbi:hypothetical protein [Pseudomonas helleri]|uniref:Uncharacterized protein n=1 Tax=Pseudomonas helleri TaxID=1608996 RepID=A0A7X2CGB6_9PSED|nr:hypothetical protein [Pseudomonas helleri]MQT93054.1 hypothetical protein [Pseudomonas helleri]MQU29826.1 hypothetical protein [Pseudomonas helleri]
MKGFRSILNASQVSDLYLEGKCIDGISQELGVSKDLIRFAFTLALRGVHPNSLSSISDFRLEDQVRILLADKYTTQGVKHEFDEFRVVWRRLYDRERERRDAIWRLELIEPGSKSAEPFLELLSAIRDADETDPIGEACALGIDEVVALVPITSVSGSIDYVGYDDIPEPWCERFLQASAGSTATIRGGYASDWEKFVRLWTAEMEMIKKHQEAAQA